jgi:hypothetical protein
LVRALIGLLVRALIGLLYAVPAAIAGYQLSLGLAKIGMTDEGWREAFALAGAVLIGVTTFSRMALFAPVLTQNCVWPGSRDADDQKQHFFFWANRTAGIGATWPSWSGFERQYMAAARLKSEQASTPKPTITVLPRCQAARRS